MPVSMGAVQAAVVTPQVRSEAAVVVDVQTGQVLADQHGDERLPIASLTKLLTVYLVEKAIAEGRLSRDGKVTISADIAAFSRDQSVANVPLTAGKNYTVHELMTATLLPSANGAALALAEAVAGDQTTFYRMMQQQLAAWDVRYAHIYSANGLSNQDLGRFRDKHSAAKAENVLSAREVAIVAQRLVKDYPDVIAITRQTKAQFAGETIHNSNQLLGEKGSTFVGLKTGLTPYDGANFVGLTTLQKRQVITVVLNTSDMTSAFSETKRLLQQVDQVVTTKTMPKKTTVKQPIHLLSARSKNGEVQLRTTQDQTRFVRKDEPKLTVTTTHVLNDVQAPISQNAVIAQGIVSSQDEEVDDYLRRPPAVDLHADKTIERTNFVTKWWRQLFFGEAYHR
jgi:D-alanyl-D-alanine carboxypeptidase (penicillin-binding protein 5/6)